MAACAGPVASLRCVWAGARLRPALGEPGRRAWVSIAGGRGDTTQRDRAGAPAPFVIRVRRQDIQMRPRTRSILSASASRKKTGDTTLSYSCVRQHPASVFGLRHPRAANLYIRVAEGYIRDLAKRRGEISDSWCQFADSSLLLPDWSEEPGRDASTGPCAPSEPPAQSAARVSPCPTIGRRTAASFADELCAMSPRSAYAVQQISQVKVQQIIFVPLYFSTTC